MIQPFLVGLSLCVAMPAFAEPAGVPLIDLVPHLTTTGAAETEVVPDQADIKLGVRQERKTADAATDAAATTAAAIVAAVVGQGVARSDIHTSFVVSATFDPAKDDKNQVVGRTFRGFEAYEGIAVRVRDLPKVGRIARDIIGKGADLIEGVTFIYSKEKQRRQDLGAEAMKDALVKAKLYTDAVGLKLGRVLQIGAGAGSGGSTTLSASVSRSEFNRLEARMRGDAVVPIEPGVQILREDVTVVWEIEGRAR